MIPHVSVLIPHHFNDNQGYLDQCLRSVLANSGVSFDVTVIADTEHPPVVPKGVKLVWDRSLSNASKKINHAMKHADGPNVLWMSDDVMIAKHLLATLSETVSKTNAICNAFSNNDIGSYYHAEPKLVAPNGLTLPLKHNHELSELNGFEQCVIDYPQKDSILITVPWIPFYCIMLSKSVFEFVGELDEKLDSRHNDEDYCLRAKHKGIRTLINLGTFAFHFGGKTLDRSVTMIERDECSKHFAEKWGLQRG